LLQHTLKALDRFTDLTGRVISWLTLLLMLITAVVVVLRYGFQIGSIAMQESITYLHASVFMLGAAYTLKHGAHVRVDILYNRFSNRARAWIESIGAIVLLIPFCVFTAFISLDFVSTSWTIREGSAEPGGIHAVFLLKSLIPLMAAGLVLQALAEIIRNLIVLASPEGKAGTAND
jgi:TRAP-type mannitol/chloroaromatic compound transport system permease small subunit